MKEDRKNELLQTLIENFTIHNQNNFAEIDKLIRPEIKNILMYKVGKWNYSANGHRLDDLVQQVIINFYCALRDKKYDCGKNNPTAYIYSITSHLLLNKQIRGKKRPLLFESDFNDLNEEGEINSGFFENMLNKGSPFSPIDESIQKIELKELLNIGMDTLKEKFRITLTLHLEGYSNVEIAVLLNVPLGTVSSRICKAKRKIGCVMRSATPR